MCKALHLNHNILAKRNHKGFTVEHFHRFLNKSVVIAAEERGTNDFFLLASQSVTLEIARRLAVLIFFAVFELSVGNFTFSSKSVSILCQN